MSNDLERRPTRLPSERIERLVRRTVAAISIVATTTFVAHVTFDEPIQWDLSIDSKLIIGTPRAVEEAVRDLPPVPIEQRVAFPGAEGYGAQAIWGLKWETAKVHRAGFFPLVAAVAVPNDSICNRSDSYVHFVTNTNPSGAGSLADIIANDIVDDTMNYVIFRTGGTVTIDGGAEQINIKKSCVYIAGQTAPGGGFQLKAVDTAPIATRNNQNPNNLVVRYLRIRADNTEQRDVVSLYDGRNQIWDHISASMGTDETWSYNNCTLAQGCHDANDLTFQNSIIGPTLTPHSTNSLIKGSDDGSTRLSRVSIHHNLFIHATVRSPRIVACDTCQVINNVTYNWESWVGGIEPGEGNNPCRFDYVRNYWEEGPWTSDNSDNIRHDDLTPPITLLCRIYAYRNISDGFQTDSTANQKNLFKFRDSGGPLPDSIFEASRFGDPRTPITEQHAAAARDSILARVGAYRKLDDSACTGGWLANRDALDDTLIYHVTNGTGPSNDAENDDVSDYGGLPTLAAGTPCTDSDNDGMPDAYEDLYAFLDKNDGTDYKEDNDGDGFINLEEYLNGTPP